jgi:Flp pilus assembly pilin Flp
MRFLVSVSTTHTGLRRTREGTRVNAIFVRLQILWHDRERGQTMAEYAVVLGIISVTILVALGALSGAIGGQLSRVTSDL